MDKDIDLGALRAFRAVVREGSFSRAALALRVPKSTLSKRVADLEAGLGAHLIERTTRHVRVTQEGEILAARADRLLGDADDIRRALGESSGVPRGHIRISVPQVLGHIVMGATAAAFRKAFPEVTLEVHFLDRAPDLLEEGFDGCIRLGPLEDSSQVARLLMHGHAVLTAHPALPGLTDIRHPDDLLHTPLVGMAVPWPGGWPLERPGESVDVQVRPALTLGSFLAIRDAALAGAGCALLPYMLARPYLATGQLVRVLPEWSTPRRGLYFVYPSAQSVTARLRALIDFLALHLAEVEAAAP